MPSPFATHEVTNQVPPLEDVDLYQSDLPLREAVGREGAGADTEALGTFGRACGSRAALENGRLANENAPRLRPFDRLGRRLDIVELHPAYHACMELSLGHGLHAKAWEHLANPGSRPRAGAQVERAAGLYMAAQMEAGHCCPVTMTNAAIATLRLEPSLAGEWIPRLLPRAYDPRFLPAAEKRAATIGMGMTEKQGGTDVRANTTRAEPTGAGGPGEAYRLTGHKWFLSAPMCDAFLMLAQAKGGLSCFLVPRFLPDGAVNALHLQRLKDKLGNRSNASSEVELKAATGWLVGGEGRGVATIIEMVTATRLDCAVSSAGLMRFGLASAVHHARHRHVMGRALIEQPVMRHVLADLALDVEAATALAFRLAATFDDWEPPRAAAWRRLMTPVTKYWVCKMAPAFLMEAMECHGGNGYIEEAPLARLYREAPVNAIWEGSGNVMALDVLRVLQRDGEAIGHVLEALRDLAGTDQHVKAGIARIEALLHDPSRLEINARGLVETLALTAAGALLRAHGATAVADAFLATRLVGACRATYGQGLGGADIAAILARVMPA